MCVRGRTACHYVVPVVPFGTSNESLLTWKVMIGGRGNQLPSAISRVDAVTATE